MAVTVTGCRSTDDRKTEDASAESPAQASTGPAKPLPLLVVNTDAPLLLDEPADQPAAAADNDENNAPCFVCHANFRSEWLAARHAGVGCPACHGDSFAHKNDENNTTPPEKMFARDAVDAACGKCHTDHDIPPAKVIARYKERGLDKAGTEPVVCTDCHGDHRLKVRTVQWDKKTGKLLSTNKQ